MKAVIHHLFNPASVYETPNDANEYQYHSYHCVYQQGSQQAVEPSDVIYMYTAI